MAIVFGDSNSAKPNGWVGQLMAQGKWYKLHAQSLRFAGTGSLVPDDIMPVDDHWTVHYWLGVNDAALWNTIPDYPALFDAAFKQDMGKLIHAEWAGRKFNIFLILPPTIIKPGLDTRPVRDYLTIFYNVIVNYFGSTQLRLIDPDDYNVLADSEDGVHLSEYSSGVFGAAVHQLEVDWEAEA